MEPNGSPARSRLRIVLLTGLGILVLLSGVLVASQGVFGRFWQRAAEPVAIKNRQNLELSAPDGLLEAERLSQLPKDLLSAPFLADLLSDDFVFYYQHNAEKLAVIGTLRRLAFEHNLTLPEQLISQLLDTPAQVALWKGDEGKLSYSLARLELGLAAPLGKVLANFISAASEIAQTDKQLKFAGEISLNKNKVPFFSLDYLSGRSLLFAFQGEHLIVASHQELLQDEPGHFRPEAQTIIEQLFANQQPFKTHFNLSDTQPKAQARISLDAHFFTLGYQDYLPALEGVRFELSEGKWQSFIGLAKGDHKARFAADLWAKAPADASLCALMPVNPAALNSIISEQQQNPKITQAFTGRSFVCWFANAPLAKPLIGAELTSDGASAEFDAEITALFDKTIRNNKVPKTTDEAGNTISPGGYAPSNIQVTDVEGGKQWQKSDGKGKPIATLLRQHNFMLFSLHAPLLQHGADTLAKRYPALGDKLPNKEAMALFLAPQGLATLLQTEIRQMAADNDLGPLLPKLTALGKKPALVAQFDAGKQADSAMSWYPLQWNSL
ncbi:MAG TPA: DUF2138 family protein [Cellvibrionaceae bacterium]|nr:DUF2138 family protein [Cellvibrionaceae bacterium]HMW72431.1 DUF2138 family protein [Cellvibrionaceae bacterium]HNG60097.1 DUF2138 family protein [Cellvibrionaceae bacterium]